MERGQGTIIPFDGKVMRDTSRGEPPVASSCCAILFSDDDSVLASDILGAFAHTLRIAGWKVGGLLQVRGAEGGAKGGDVCLVDVSGAHTFRISQHLGAGSTSCSVDPAGMAEASGALRKALTDQVDLLVINKFGKTEAEGAGFMQEIAAAVAMGIPVLTTVHKKYLAQWTRFTGDLAQLVPADTTALARWWGTLAADQKARA